MKPLLSPGLVRRSLAGHSWLGILIGAGMYLVCLSGTLLVFIDTLVRWEQPGVEEFRTWTPELVQRGFDEVFADPQRVTPHLYAILPTPSQPRLRYASEDASWYAGADGSVGPAERNAFTEMLVELHYYLHLPHAWGMILVSALGALLVAMIVTGYLAHPSLLKDAFRWRIAGSRRIALTDLHNRLSVWGTPFHLMIGVTGAYFGFALILATIWSTLYADGSPRVVFDSLFGGEPAIEQTAGALRIDRALADVRVRAPDEPPFLVVVHEADQPQQRHITVSTRLPGKLRYAEEYTYDSNGDYVTTLGMGDADPGKAVVYSMYRLHFGSFAGPGVKLLFGLLGLALTVVSATGFSIWLARRGHRSWLDDLWVAVVRGAPIAIMVAACGYLLTDLNPLVTFWCGYLLCGVGALWLQDDERARRSLDLIAAIACASTAAVHVLVHGPVGGAVAVVNVALLATAWVFAVQSGALRRHRGAALGIDPV